MIIQRRLSKNLIDPERNTLFLTFKRFFQNSLSDFDVIFSLHFIICNLPLRYEIGSITRCLDIHHPSLRLHFPDSHQS